MVILRWLLALTFSVVADLACPALPGALEALEDPEAAVRLGGGRRLADRGPAGSRVAPRDDRSAGVIRVAVAQRVVPPSRLDRAGKARKIPTSSLSDPPSASEPH